MFERVGAFWLQVNEEKKNKNQLAVERLDIECWGNKRITAIK